ncbi:MAG: hypothetical protein RR263_02065 [Oscillospiraceae bacterium]
MMFNVCEDCGSNLDPNEICECRKTVKEKAAVNLSPVEKKVKSMNNQISIRNTQVVQPTGNFLLDPTAMKNLVATATYLSQSTMIPKEYQGNVGSCLIACEMSVRVNLSPLMVMQQLAVVNGRPTWSGQACTALINQSRRYDKPLKIVFVGDKDTENWGAYAVAYQGNEEFRGTTVDWKLVKGEGWDTRNGSKWKTMPEQMFKYRAASFFAKEHCPDILMGCMVEGEAEDIFYEQERKISSREELSEIDELNQQLGADE